MTTTGGTGGPLTDRTGVAYLASNGYDSYSHIYAAGIDTSKPVGLFVWLHGDGAYEYLNPTSTLYLAGPNGIVAAAKERNCIVLVPLTPDSGTTNGRTWWKWGSGNAQYLRELIVSEIYGKYNIDLGKIWIAGFSGGAETTTAIFLPTQANNLQIEGGGFMPFGGGPRPSWYEISEAWTPNFDPAVFHGYWIVGENDTAENATDGYDAVLAAQAGYDWYGTKGIPTDIYYVPGQTHILSPEWGNLMRAAWVKYDSAGGPAQSGVYIGSQSVIGVYVGSTPVTAVYVGAEMVWPSSGVVQITLGTGTQARDQLRAALTARGLDYATVTKIPFDIELVGTGATRAMFRDCAALTHAPAMDTSNVTDMGYMFEDCASLTHAPDIDTSNVTNMTYMFSGCVSLTRAPSLDTSSVTITGYMFSGCVSLTHVPDMDTSQVTYMANMFHNCAELTDGNVRLIGRHPNVTTTGMIAGSGLTREPFVVQITLGAGNQARDQLRAALTARGLSYQTVEELPFDIELVGTGSAQNMFNGCASLTHVPDLDTSQVTDMRYMFQDCAALTHVPDMDTAQVTTVGGMFWGCASLADGNVRLIGRHPQVATWDMITSSGLTREPFYDAAGNPI